ncbi:MAG TPA: hypothetical protein VKY73_21520 [Polyangiaceae bacterium]|nr:hypothetical protein [Polyangiaceae bacterium]
MSRKLVAWVHPILVAGLLFGAARAEARVEATSEYTKAQTFSAALRFVRVDRGYEVIEKDADAAYVLFRYPLPGNKGEANGSVEVVETPSGVKLFVQLPRLPEYHEVVLRDALLRKLRDEYGPPPRAPKTPPPEKPKDPPKAES